MTEYRWGGLDRYDAIVCVLAVGFVLHQVLVLNEPLLVTTAQGLVLMFLFLGRSRFIKIEADKTTEEE